MTADNPPATAPLDHLTPTTFAMRLVMGLATETEAVVGAADLRDIVGLTGLDMGAEIEAAVAGDVVDDLAGQWTPRELGEVFVELKERIGGDFSVEEATDGKVVLTNTRCPFGASVAGRPGLCMMTSSVFGGIAARRFGYARVDVEEAIARGHDGCRVTVHLQRPNAPPGDWSEEYHGEEE